MILYLAKLLILLPILGLLIWGSLWLTKTMQGRIGNRPGAHGDLELIASKMLAPGLRVAVVRFKTREILLASSRQGIVPLCEVEADNEQPDEGAAQ